MLRSPQRAEMFPDFLCIGAQKAGTTWLHDNLHRHPQVWLPPVKELHHLDHRPPGWRKRLFGKPAHLALARAHLKDTITAFALGRNSASDLAWATRFCLLPRNDRWYASLFPRPPGRITGEVCPGYARIPAEAVAHVRRLMPDTRIVYLLRDPVERTWSAAAMRFRKPGQGWSIETTDEGEIERQLTDPRTLAHSDYLRNLAAWRAHFPEERIFIGFFDLLKDDPHAFLGSILGFLGVDDGGRAIPSDVGRKRNPGRGETMPERYRCLLSRLLLDQVRALDTTFSNPYTRRWREEAERYV